MDRVIKIADYEIPVRATAAALIAYKANFGRDGLRDLIALSKAATEGGVDAMDADVVYCFFWVFAKAADPTIPPLEEWLEGFDVPPLDFVTAAMPQVVELLTASTKGATPVKKTTAGAKKRK